MHNLHQGRCEDRYSEEDEKVQQLLHSLPPQRKKKHNLKANSGCQRRLEHLDLHNTCLFFFFFFRISGYDAGSPECSKETRFDMIILQLGSPLCHMPDLSVGRGMQLALLTINQPDGGGGGWWLWRRRRCCDGEVLAAAGCWPTFHYTHTHTHNQLLHVCKRLLQHSPVLLSHLLPRTSFVPFLLVSSHSHLARLYSSPFFFHLKASNIHHPSAQIHSAPRAAVRRAQQGESSEWTKYEDISSS